jgi:quercetin dioxygenase-like cupin family protein
MAFITAPQPVITAASAGTVFHAFGQKITILLDGEKTGRNYTQWIDETPPGGGPPPHRHWNDDEWFFVLEGQVSFFDGNEWHSASPGASAFMPRGSIHTFKNNGTSTLKMLVTTAPSGFESFFSRCAAEFARPGGPNMPRIVGIAADHGIEFVQP